MAFIPPIFSWDVNSVPLDEAEKQHFQFFAQECSGNYFDIMFHIEHQITGLTHPQPQPQPPNTVEEPTTYPPLHSSHRSIFLSSSQLLENGPLYMPLLHFPHPIIPRELMAKMMPELIAYAKNVLQNCSPSSSGLHFESGNFRLFKLVVNIVVRKQYGDILDRILEESARFKAATESIKIVNLARGAAKVRCPSCYVEFIDGMGVSVLPCKHMYHHECIDEWLSLRRRYTCPSCRYPLAARPHHQAGST